MPRLQLIFSLLLAGGVFQVQPIPSTEEDHAKLRHKKQVFTGCTAESLSETFNFKAGVHISDTLAQVLVGLSRDPQNGGIYFTMSDKFLQNLLNRNIAPNFVYAWIALCQIIDEDRVNRAQGIIISVEDSIQTGLDDFYGDGIDPELRRTFYDVAPFISSAMNGDVTEAKKIVPELAKHFNDFDQLNHIDGSTKMNILRRVDLELKDWAEAFLRYVD